MRCHLCSRCLHYDSSPSYVSVAKMGTVIVGSCSRDHWNKLSYSVLCLIDDVRTNCALSIEMGSENLTDHFDIAKYYFMVMLVDS